MKVIIKTAAELVGGKADKYYCIATILGAGYTAHYYPARNISVQDVCDQLQSDSSCILADNPYIGDDGQYHLRYAIKGESEFSSVNGWTENQVRGDSLFAFKTL